MIKLYTEKMVVRGIKFRKIIKITGVMPRRQLPKKYFDETPFVSYRKAIIGQVISPDNRGVYLKDGAGMYKLPLTGEEAILKNEVSFQMIISLIKEAGERLSVLRKKEKELIEEWRGEETFVI